MIAVNDKKIPWREGMTVTELLDGIADPHPYAVVRVNGRYVSRPHFDDTLVPDGAEIYLIPMIAGG